MVKNPHTNAGDRDVGSIPGGRDTLEKKMVTHSSILAWKILWVEEPGGLQSIGSQRVRHDWVTEHAKILCFAYLSLPIPQFLEITILFTISAVFLFSRMSYSWNQTVYVWYISVHSLISCIIILNKLLSIRLINNKKKIFILPLLNISLMFLLLSYRSVSDILFPFFKELFKGFFQVFCQQIP